MSPMRTIVSGRSSASTRTAAQKLSVAESNRIIAVAEGYILRAAPPARSSLVFGSWIDRQMIRNMYFVFAVLPIAFPSSVTYAQPADCPTRRGPPATIPLQLGLTGLPGVPTGLQGSLEANIPASPGGELCETEAPVVPKDVLHGPPARDLLRGPGTPDPISGPGASPQAGIGFQKEPTPR